MKADFECFISSFEENDISCSQMQKHFDKWWKSIIACESQVT